MNTYNYSPVWGGYGLNFMNHPGGFIVLLLVLIIWSVIWKGWALWLAARRGEKAWFVLMLILNTLGLLEIIYIFLVAKRKDTLLK